MQGKVFRSGDSMVVSLPAEALQFLGIGEGSAVSLALDTDLRQLVITVAELQPPVDIDVEFAHQVSDFITRYRPALQALAQGNGDRGRRSCWLQVGLAG